MLLALILAAHASPYDAEAMGGADLACSACKLFLETFHSECAKTVFKKPKSVQAVYKERMKEIFKAKSMGKNTQQRLLAELQSSPPSKAHALYKRLCERKQPFPCAEEFTDSPESDSTDGISAKAEKAQLALEATVAAAKGGTQWAVEGAEGSRRYVDFNKAMQSGKVSNLQMGGDVADKLHGAFSGLAEDHGGTLTSAIAEVSRVYDAGLDKNFCGQEAKACEDHGEDGSVRDEL